MLVGLPRSVYGSLQVTGEEGAAHVQHLEYLMGRLKDSQARLMGVEQQLEQQVEIQSDLQARLERAEEERREQQQQHEAEIATLRELHGLVVCCVTMVPCIQTTRSPPTFQNRCSGVSGFRFQTLDYPIARSPRALPAPLPHTLFHCERESAASISVPTVSHKHCWLPSNC